MHAVQACYSYSNCFSNAYGFYLFIELLYSAKPAMPPAKASLLTSWGTSTSKFL